MNWGYRIALFFGAFIAFMLFMLYKCMQVDHELVAADYYAQEIGFQQKIDEQNNVKSLAQKPSWEIGSEAFLLTIPSRIKEGKVTFFRPSDGSLDFSENVLLDSLNQQAIPLSKFKRGLYNLQLSWSDTEKNYYIEKQIRIP